MYTPRWFVRNHVRMLRQVVGIIRRKYFVSASICKHQIFALRLQRFHLQHMPPVLPRCYQSYRTLWSLSMSVHVWSDVGIWGVSINEEPPKWMVSFMENPVQVDDLGVPLFQEPPQSGVFSSQVVRPTFGSAANACAIFGSAFTTGWRMPCVGWPKWDPGFLPSGNLLHSFGK